MNQTKPTVNHSFKPSALLFVILLAGFSLRLWGISFGLPYLYHADEPIVVNHALAYASGDLNPHFFKIPPLVSYLLSICYGIYFLILKTFDSIRSTSDFARFFLDNPTTFYLIGRVIFGALFAMAGIVALYALVKKYFSVRTAIISATILSFTFLHVRDSHYIYTDIPLLICLTISFFPIFSILEQGRRTSYVLFGILAGLCVATKYNGIFIFIPFVLAHTIYTLTNGKQPVNINLLASFSITVLTYFILNPFSFLDFQFFKQELLIQAAAEARIGFFHHLVYSLNSGLGFPLLVISFLGVARCICSKNQRSLLFLCFIAAYYAVLALKSQPYDRYALPLVPFLVFFAADFLEWLRKRFHIKTFLYILLVGVTLSVSIFKIALCNQIMTKTDTRTMAYNWCMANIPTQSKVAISNQFFAPRLKPTAQELQKKLAGNEITVRAGVQEKRLNLMIELAKQSTEPRYELFYLTKNSGTFVFSKPNLPFDPVVIQNFGVQYVIFSNLCTPESNTLHSWLKTRTTLVGKFSPYRNEIVACPIDPRPITGAPFLMKDLLERQANGPKIEIYKLKQ